jgi:penicillin-binding protein 1C
MSGARPPGRSRPWGRIARVGACASVLVMAFFAWVWAVPFPKEALRRDTQTSTMVLDRSGRLLREVLSSEETRGRWAPLSEISDNLVLATIHAEDRRFRDHPGSDFIAIARSLWIDVTSGEARTGASTLTQQVVKLTLQRGQPRDLGTKAMEIVWAWRLELALSKDEILEQYLNRAPYGNQLVGAEAASWMYLGKPASLLSLAEAAFLAGLPNSPSRLNPYRFLERARARQRWILDLMLARGAIEEQAWRVAVNEPLALLPRRGGARAPHLTAQVANLVRSLPTPLRPVTLGTTLDGRLQESLERLLAAQRPEDAVAGRFQAAAVVLDTTTSEVLAWVGSRGFSDAAALGQNDGVIALRQPGSALKPFVYGAWFEAGGAYDALLDDRPMSFATPTGLYRPENYDRAFHGLVDVRTALASSLNIPAVATLDRIGVPRLLDLLRRLGLGTLKESHDHYGLGLALGDGEVRLVDLAGAYATLGRLGRHRPVHWLASADAAEERVLSEETCFVLLEMLADDRARGIGFGLAGPFDLPYRLAAKTGTSSDFRDNWAVAVTPRHTIAVWVGNFDGRPMERRPGRSGAAPLLRQIAQTLYPEAADRGAVPWFEPPRGLVLRDGEWARR